MAIPTNIQAAIVTKWNATTGLGASGVVLRYGRVDEGTAKPYATFADLLNTPVDAFNAAKIIDKWLYQIDVYDIDSDNVATILDLIRTTYHRQSLSMSEGSLLSAFRVGSGMLIEPAEDKNSQNVYHGFIRFRFTVDT